MGHWPVSGKRTLDITTALAYQHSGIHRDDEGGLNPGSGQSSRREGMDRCRPQREGVYYRLTPPPLRRARGLLGASLKNSLNGPRWFLKTIRSF